LKKILRLLFKLLLVLVSLGLVVFIALKLMYNDDVPVGESGKAADALAQQMLDALAFEKFQAAKELQWTFRDKHTYHWYLQQHIVDVYWDEYKVTYHTKDLQKSSAFLDGIPLEGEAKTEAITYAVSNFNNDSFWLVAPFKVFDKGTTRSLVQDEGKRKLLVQYTTGGTTPGDAYLWELDEQYLPVAFKMWVSIIPFDGVEATWINWERTSAGFLLPTSRTFFGLEIPISNVKVVP
jgi:hypothetical protein